MLYGTLAILVLNSSIHFYTVPHQTTTVIRRLTPEFEAVGASLKVPLWYTFARVTVPMSLLAILEIAIYFFVNAMTTVSAVIFFYGPSPKRLPWRWCIWTKAGSRVQRRRWPV